MEAKFELDCNSVDEIQKLIGDYGDTALKTIDSVLHNEGAAEIKSKIMQILPTSGRRWKGKGTAAKNAQPFTQEKEMLSVTTKTVKKYNYLYFPDDGSITRRHAGNQQFMRRGAENSVNKIIELCTGKLTENF